MFFGTKDVCVDSDELFCDKTVPICLVLVDLMGGWQTKHDGFQNYLQVKPVWIFTWFINSAML